MNEGLATRAHQRKAQVSVTTPAVRGGGIMGPVGFVLLFLSVSLVGALESNGERREMKEGWRRAEMGLQSF